MNELALVFFTILAQAAAGLCLAMSFLNLLNSKKNIEIVTAKGVFAILALAITGALASMVHLGKPFRAANVLSGVGKSPLSLEIISLSLFVSAIGVVFLLLLKKHPRANNKVLLLVCALCGMFMVYSMGKVYSIPTVEMWNSSYTYMQFFMSALLLGFVAASFYSLSIKDTKTTRFINLLATGAIVLHLSCLPLILKHYGFMEMASQFSLANNWPVVRLVALFLGLLIWFIPQFAGFSERAKRYSFSIAIALLFCSELAGRIYFYDLLSLRAL